MSIIFRSIFLAGLGALIVLQFFAANRATDSLFAASSVNATHRTKVNAWAAQLGENSGTVLARLDVLRAEIHGDLCARGAQTHCLAGMCVTVPLDGCAQK